MVNKVAANKMVVMGVELELEVHKKVVVQEEQVVLVDDMGVVMDPMVVDMMVALVVGMAQMGLDSCTQMMVGGSYY